MAEVYTLFYDVEPKGQAKNTMDSFGWRRRIHCINDIAMEEFFNQFGNARDKARRFHYKCLCPGCKKKAINSHLVQQHPFLESIAEEGKVYQIKDNEIDPRSGDFSDSREQILSIRQVLSMPLFCSEHDNNLFKPIEYGEIDFESAQTFLLFSLRALVSQRYFEEKRQVLYQNTGFGGEPFDVQREYSTHILERFDSTIGLLYGDIVSKDYDDYVFKVVDLPYIPVCGSDAVVDENEMVEAYSGGTVVIKPLNVLYITLLPIKEEQIVKVIIGYNKRYVGQRQRQFYQRVGKDNSRKMLLELILRMKNWCSSPSLFAGLGFADIYEAKRIKIVMEDGGC